MPRQQERTLIIVKPHAVGRGLTGEFLARFERMGLRIAAIKVVKGDRDLWERFYPSDEAWLRNVGGKTGEDAKARGLDVKARFGTDDPEEIGKLVGRFHGSNHMRSRGVGGGYRRGITLKKF